MNSQRCGYKYVAQRWGTCGIVCMECYIGIIFCLQTALIGMYLYIYLATGNIIQANESPENGQKSDGFMNPGQALGWIVGFLILLWLSRKIIKASRMCFFFLL